MMGKSFQIQALRGSFNIIREKKLSEIGKIRTSFRQFFLLAKKIK